MDMDKVDELIGGFIHMLGSTEQKDIDADTRENLAESIGSPEYKAARTVVVAVLNKAVDNIMYMSKNMEGVRRDGSACAECGKVIRYRMISHGHKLGCKKGASKKNKSGKK